MATVVYSCRSWESGGQLCIWADVKMFNGGPVAGDIRVVHRERSFVLKLPGVSRFLPVGLRWWFLLVPWNKSESIYP